MIDNLIKKMKALALQITIMSETIINQELMHYDINSRLCWEHVENENIDIHLSQNQVWEEEIIR